MLSKDKQIAGLVKLGQFLNDFIGADDLVQTDAQRELSAVLAISERENGWFTKDNLKLAIGSWAKLLTEENLNKWLENYQIAKSPKRVGLILAGNIPMVGFHDVLSVVLSQHIPIIKLSSKDLYLIPHLLKLWNEFSDGSVRYEMVDRLENFDAVIATGSNNTARYLEYYFKNYRSIIRKNRTSVAVLKGDETDAQLQLLAQDIFSYFGLGCRNVTRLFLPADFPLDRLFENFVEYGGIINHHKYANNYDYNKAVYLLNQDKFWDNNFVMMREEESLFSPLSVLNFSRYSDLQEVRDFLRIHSEDIQAVVAAPDLGLDSVDFGQAQYPPLDTYADNVDTMKFLEII